MRTALYTLWLLIIGSGLSAQDLHFSQYDLHPMQNNPALTGVFEGQWRVAGLYRNQWASVPVDYQSYAVAADAKLIRREKSGLALGVTAANDQAGDALLRWTQFGLRLGVSRAVAEKHALSGGFSVDMVQRSLDPSRLRFQNQWDGDLFNPSLSTGENLASRSETAPSLGAGLNWLYHSGYGSRTQFRAGLGVFHLNRPAVDLDPQSTWALPLRLAGGGEAVLMVQDALDVLAFGNWQRMGNAQEVLFGAGARLHTGDLAFSLSLLHRLADALIPAIRVERGPWTVGLAYDVNVSDFKRATNRRGGIELALVYRSLPVEPPKVQKVCPIF